MDAPMPVEVQTEWGTFLDTHRDLVPGQDVYLEIFENGWLFPLQRMRETAAMIRMAREIEPRTVIEIGSDKGGSFFHWIHGLPSVSKAIAVEIRGVPFDAEFADYFRDRRILSLAASSYEYRTVRTVSEFIGTGFADCLFIDGDKANVAKDFKRYAPMIRKGGLIFIHDIVDDIEPRRFFKSLAGTYRTSEIINTSEYDEIERRERSGLPPASAYEGWFRIWKRTSCGVGVVHV